VEYQQLTGKIEAIHKTLERYDGKSHAMQRQIDMLITANEMQREQNERLNNELTDLTDLHQIEMSAIKTDLKNLEDRLLYKFNDYWSELLEKLDKLDTRVSSTLYSVER
jgi:chromosome segregation ATPase